MKEERTTSVNKGFASGVVTCKLCTSIKVSTWLTVLCPETCTKAKPQTVKSSILVEVRSDQSFQVAAPVPNPPPNSSKYLTLGLDLNNCIQ